MARRRSRSASRKRKRSRKRSHSKSKTSYRTVMLGGKRVRFKKRKRKYATEAAMVKGMAAKGVHPAIIRRAVFVRRNGGF